MEKEARRDHKGTQTEDIADIEDPKTGDSTSVSDFKDEHQQALKNRKTKNQLTKNFTSLGKKINKILKKK